MDKVISNVKQDALLASAILETFRRQNEAEIEDISRFLYALRNAKIDIGEIDLRRIPGGFYSEDLEILMSHYLDAGFVGQQSPLKLNPEGIKFLNEIVEEERNNNREGMERVQQILKAVD